MTGGRAHRAHVDGLRAVAVLGVLAFHLRENRVPGGFAGVDVFFVISGFLITGQLLGELAEERFSYREFYRRRVRRIAPAMLAVVLATVVASQALLLPEDAVATAWSALWSVAGLANAWFWRHLDAGYFAEDAATVPLLHLWSLGIEEQFYLLWPPLLRLLSRRSTARTRAAGAGAPLSPVAIAGLGAIAALSFALGSAIAPKAPAFAYYMLPTRAGELLLGALVAIAVRSDLASRLGPRGAAALGAAGLLAILASFLGLSGDDPFPGLLAVPPTLGTAAILLAGEATSGATIRLLSHSALAWTGLRSYAIYLWHWPFVAFWRYGHGSLDRLPTIGVLVATFATAWATHRWLEEPARRSDDPPARVFARLYALPAAVVALVAGFVLATGGFGLRLLVGSYPADLARLRETTREARMLAESVAAAGGGPGGLAPLPREVSGPESAPETTILWGDSNAAHYVGLLSAFAEAAPFRFRHASIFGCPGILEDPARFARPAAREKCRRAAPSMRAMLGEHATVVLATRWSRYLPGTSGFLDEVVATVESIRSTGSRVVLLGETPEMAGFDRRCLEKALSFPFLRCTAPGWRPVPPETAATNARLRDYAARTPGVAYWDPNDVLCPSGRCSPYGASGEPLFRDPLHLSPTGSRAVGDAVLRSTGLPEVFRDDHSTAGAVRSR